MKKNRNVGVFLSGCRHFRLPSAFILAAVLAPAAPAAAQVFPTKPIRIVIPFPPGGSNDLVARLVGDKLRASMGQPVVPENRPGGNNIIATEIVAKSAPDGHTLLIANTQHTVNPSLFPKLPYDALKDFTPVGLATSVYFALTVHPSVPATSVKQFIAVAKARPGALTYASAGSGSPHHLAMELVKSMAKVELTHIPYKGAGQLVPALIAGEVTSVIGAINSLLPHVQTGRLRLLAIAGNRRTPLLPDVPTIAEAALPGFALENWNGFLAPAGTPRAIVDRLNVELVKALHDPEVRDRLIPQGIEVIPSTPDEFQEALKSHMAKWAKIIKAAGIKLE